MISGAMAASARNATVLTSPNALGEAAFDPDSPNNSLYKWVGLSIVIGSAILSNLGVNVQKLSHVRVRPVDPLVRYVCGL